MNKRALLIILALVAVVLVGSVSWSVAQTSGDVAACVKDGKVKLLGYAEDISCSGDERRISWGDDQELSFTGTNFSIEHGNSVNLSALQERTLTPGPTFLTIVDIEGTTGLSPSITVGADGLPIISYYDYTNYDLKVAHCTDVACSGATTTTVDSAGDVGRYPSITVGADGLPIISYDDSTNGGPKVAHCIDLACTSATITSIDSAGQYSSITVGSDGLPVISYHGDRGLKVAHCNDVACTSATTTIVTSVGSGYFTSITAGADGLPIISYLDMDHYDLEVTHCADLSCTSGTTTIVDHAGNITHPSITVGADGLPIISYFTFTDGPSLKVTHCDDVACTSATTTPVINRGFIGGYSSITLGADGLPIISGLYGTHTGYGLFVAHCSNVICTSATNAPVDIAGNVGIHSSITVGVDGLPIISYYDLTNGDLKVAHCSNKFCVPFFSRR